MKKQIIYVILIMLFTSVESVLNAQIITVGSGSYTASFPGTDKEGRNSYPSGTPQLSGKAKGRPVESNDWWSKLVKENHASNLFSYPYTLKTDNSGLVVSYIPRGVIDDLLPLTVGVSGMNASNTTVSDFSDWTVTMNWNDGSHEFEATAGIGMPFLYFTKKASDVVEINVTSTTAKVTINGEMLIMENVKNGASFAVYAPTGSTWTKNGSTYLSSLNGKNYWSLAFLPLTATNIPAVADEYQKYAYVFPKDTRVEWNYNEKNSVVRTDFTVDTEVKEGTSTNFLLGLLPHQWSNLASDSPQPKGYSYQNIRGEIKTLVGNQFSVENTFYGILPTLPYVNPYSPGFDENRLIEKITAIQDDKIGDWTDSYNDGQLMNRLIQTGRIAGEMGNTEALNAILETIKERVENWLKADEGEVAFLFYYNNTWSALLGYPAGHGQDSNLNDHHFHWGYFIHAAAFIELYQPGWAVKWGDMVNLLVRDAAGTDRNDKMFPFLRNFSPYAGHSWANGFATFPQGNDQESTSESMQFNSSLIHWGTITGNKTIRDLGIYLYTTEQTAIEEYWFDMYGRTFPSTQQYSLVSRIWGNDLDNGTFWTTDIAASYGIELYPIHAGSLYLGHNKEYVAKLWNEIKSNTGITGNQANDNLWHDIMWQYASFINPAEAIAMHDSYENRSLKFGVSNALTYHWIHAMNALGQPDTSITADYPIATAFNLNNGRITYVAHNYNSTPLKVIFSDGYVLNVPARQMAFESAGNSLPMVTITNPTNNSGFKPNQTITISVSAVDYNDLDIVKVEFYQNDIWIGSDVTYPYSINWTPSEGNYTLSAKAVNSNGDIGTSQPVYVIVSYETSCTQTSQEASQGSFSEGYTVTFETVGTNVHITVELHDKDKNGLVAYLWNQTPFSEMSMTGMQENKFSVTLTGKEPGTEISVACKFDYEAGGMVVTKYMTYKVGELCKATSIKDEPLDELTIYPVPVENNVYIYNPEGISRVTITDIQGKTMVDKTYSSNRVEIDLTGWYSGVYILIVESPKNRIIKKIIKK